MSYSYSDIESLVRSELYESTTIVLTSSDLYNAINDGYKQVSINALCIEKELLMVIDAGCNLMRVPGVSVKYIELLTVDELIFEDTPDTEWENTSDTEWDIAETRFSYPNRGLVKATPQMIGHLKIDKSHPQYWFPWGDLVYIEPIPDYRYTLRIHYADYPASELVLNDDTLSDLPLAFQHCVVDFALYVLCLKLQRWSKAQAFYNRYIGNLVARRKEYIEQNVEGRYAHEMPNRVEKVSGR